MSWSETVGVVTQSIQELSEGKKPKVKLEAVVDALTGWVNSGLCEYTEGSYEAVGRRSVWVFDSGHLVTIGTDITITISHVDEEFTAESPMPFPDSIEPSNWSFNPQANGWARNENLTTVELIEFLDNLAVEAGSVPKLFLPIEYRLEYVEDYLDADDEDEDYVALGKLAAVFNDPAQKAILDSLSPWVIELGGEDDYMPYYCDFYRFQRFTSWLEETGKWMVILDEHCAACSRGSRDAEVANNPKLKDAPVFMTWGQNSQGAYLPNGTMWAEVYVDEEEHERFLKRNARNFGLDIGEWEGDKFEFSGGVTFGE